MHAAAAAAWPTSMAMGPSLWLQECWCPLSLHKWCGLAVLQASGVQQPHQLRRQHCRPVPRFVPVHVHVVSWQGGVAWWAELADIGCANCQAGLELPGWSVLNFTGMPLILAGYRGQVVNRALCACHRTAGVVRGFTSTLSCGNPCLTAHMNDNSVPNE